MEFLLQGLHAAGGTAGFCVIFRVPIREIPVCSFIGGSGWVLYKLVVAASSGNPIFATFLAASLVGLLSEIAARALKEPTTLFTVAGVLPLVPGYHIFKAMESLMNNNMASSETWLTDPVKSAVASALGLLAIGAVFNVIQTIYYKTVHVTTDVIDSFKHHE